MILKKPHTRKVKKSVVEKNTIKATITLKNKKSKAIKNAKIILKAGNKKYNLKSVKGHERQKLRCSHTLAEM